MAVLHGESTLGGVTCRNALHCKQSKGARPARISFNGKPKATVSATGAFGLPLNEFDCGRRPRQFASFGPSVVPGRL